MSTYRQVQAWRKNSYSGNSVDCVEVARAEDLVAVRDSKDCYEHVLAFSTVEWDVFLVGVRDGHFKF